MGVFHIRQNKHHRWSFDKDQLYEYHLGGALHPHVRWWEATDLPRRKVNIVEFGDELTLISLVCEDLALIDDVSRIVRAVGPTIVITPLLDGPQLTTRWSARYASFMADDPGSAVLTLSSHGMVQRSRPHGHEASKVVGLWKDSVRGPREIPLEPGAQGVLLTICSDRATRRTSDGRLPINNTTNIFDVALHQVRINRDAVAPVIRSTFDGEGSWPVMTPGPTYPAAFPEVGTPVAAADIAGHQRIWRASWRTPGRLCTDLVGQDNDRRTRCNQRRFGAEADAVPEAAQGARGRQASPLSVCLSGVFWHTHRACGMRMQSGSTFPPAWGLGGTE